ncbi:hypothetical protein J4E93_000811 [Alternaria ventricosa]|uniref:uncharacterized protein n=1 Tax=Alternaria ventricosa TaxID=1187951 RepID=UPI0020C278CF|nr:uncharacterized protein J4E93_000811 [Alternaria ventricosa]KAI4656094.1 hypothetical protein J4E93_000811 [Alternaria ventricosa]
MPKLRKARIAGYRRSVRSGDGPNTLAFDAVNFGMWSGEEVVKGVVFQAFNLEEERRVIEYAGGSGEVKQVVMKVACPSVLGLAGKMETVLGRIFVPEGDGDTLVGSEDSNRSTMAVDGDRNEDFIDEFSDEDFSETSSQATVEGHPTPRISPSISTLNDADVPHRSLDDLPLSAINEHPADSMIETTDWAATRQVETTDINQIEEPEPVQEAEVTEDVVTVESHEVEESEEESEEEDQDTQETEEAEVTEDKTDTISMSSTRSLRPSDFQRFLGAESARAAPVPSPWQPTIPWEKRTALAPVRNEIVRTPSQFSGTETRRRKTSDSIKSLVDHFENLSPASTPTKDKFGKEGSIKDGSAKEGFIKDNSFKEGSVKGGSTKNTSKDADEGV